MGGQTLWECDWCNRNFTRKKCEALRYSHKFCSEYCYRMYQNSDENKKRVSQQFMGKSSGQENWRWKGGKSHSNGYVVITKPNNPQADKRGRVYEHRHIIEQWLGRPLKVEEEVHHINGIKDDNRIENLSIETHSSHRKPHREVVSENRQLKAENMKLRLLIYSLLAHSIGVQHGHN